MAKIAVFAGLMILFFMNPLLCLAIALLWWGSGALARKQGLLEGSDEDRTGDDTSDADGREGT